MPYLQHQQRQQSSKNNLKLIRISKVETNGTFHGYEYTADNGGDGYEMNDKRRLIELERSLNQYFGCAARNTVIGNVGRLCKNQFVAVSVGKQWLRGCIMKCDRSDKRLKYRVLLIDYGQEIDVNDKDLHILPLQFNTDYLQSQFIKIALYGVVPIYFDISLASESCFRESDRWCPKDIYYFEEILEEANEMYFEEIRRCDEFRFGHLFITRSMGMQRLQDVLVQWNYAMPCAPQYFDTKIATFVKTFRKSSSVIDCEVGLLRALYPKIEFSIIITNTKTVGDVATKNNNTSIDAVAVTTITTVTTPSNHSESGELKSSGSTTDSSVAIPQQSNVDSDTDTDASIESDRIILSCSSNKRDDEDYNDENANTRSNVNNWSAVLDEKATSDVNLINKILVLGGNSDDGNMIFEPTHSLKNQPLDEKTLDMLDKLQIRDLSQCQKYVIPAMMTKKNITLIDGPQTGKITGCMMALISLLRKGQREKDSLKGPGPRSIVVCPYSSRCELIQTRCIRMIEGKLNYVGNNDYDDIRVNLAYGCGTKLEKEKALELTKGYDIVVCTPRCLLRLLKYEALFNLRKLSHVIFDKMHILLDSYWAEMLEIMKEIRRNERRPQRVIISNKYTKTLRQFILDDVTRKRGMLLISCYLEAAIFTHFKPRWNFINDNDDDNIQKLNCILDVLNNETRNRNVVVVCNEDDDVPEFWRKSDRNPIYSILKVDFEIKETINLWKRAANEGRHPVLICNDYTLAESRVYEADCLIHHSLPKSKRQFLYRFSVFVDRVQSLSNMRCIVSTDTGMKNVNGVENSPTGSRSKQLLHRHLPPVCYVYSNAENIKQFPLITEIMRQSRAKIPLVVERLCQKLVVEKEEQKKDVDLCVNFKQFGKCVDEATCNMRHVVLKEDLADQDLPTVGEIKLEIKRVYSPTHFAARLIEYNAPFEDNNRPKISLPSPLTVVNKMNSYFSNVNHRMNCGQLLKINDIVAVEKPVNIFKRAKIIKFIEYTTPTTDGNNAASAKPKRAQIKFIDDGSFDNVSTAELMELPAHLASIPAVMVDIFLCNLLPIDEDSTWGQNITNIVENVIEKRCHTGDTHIYGQIRLALGRSLWLHPFDFKRWCGSMNEMILLPSLSKYLVRKKLAVTNEKHLSTFQQHCRKIGLPVSDDIHIAFRSRERTENVGGGGSTDSCDENFFDAIDATAFHQQYQDQDQEPSNLVDQQNRMPVKVPSVQVLVENETKAETKTETETEIESESESVLIARCNELGLFNKPFPILLEEQHQHQKEMRTNEVEIVKSSYPKPAIEWWEDISYVHLTFKVNVDNYKLMLISDDLIFFRAEVDDKIYKFHQVLHSCVVTSNFTPRKSGVTIRVKMEKLSKGIKWGRLIKSREPARWIKLDPYHVHSMARSVTTTNTTCTTATVTGSISTTTAINTNTTNHIHGRISRKEILPDGCDKYEMMNGHHNSIDEDDDDDDDDGYEYIGFGKYD